MASFTTRVVLIDADRDEYEDLHEYMHGAGFSKTIKGQDGDVYKLPDAEYDYQGEVTLADVLAKAKAAAAKTGLTYRILVTELRGRTWANLEPA